VSVDIADNPGLAVAGSDVQLDSGATWRLLLRSKTFMVGAFIIGFWIVCAVLQSRLTPHDPFATSTNVLAHPSSSHWFGTDKVGRDVFSRVIAGARDILLVAPIATLLGVIGGTILGLVTGYLRGVVDDVISRIAEAILALPLVVLAVLVIVAVGQSTTAVIIVIAAVFTPLIGRTVRTAVLQERELEYVQAAKLRGEHAPYIMFVEILPNVAAPILVEATVRLGYAVFTVATLSFLGYGLQPPSPDWALQVADHYTLVQFAWWTVLFPSLAIASLVVGVNLMSDGVTAVLES
jgi:peptide/nickel transport system permease protein